MRGAYVLGNLFSFGRSVEVVDRLAETFANSIANYLQLVTRHQFDPNKETSWEDPRSSDH